MIRYALFLVCLLPLAANAAVDYKDADFSINLGSDWELVPCNNKDQVAFMSKSQEISIKVMSVSVHMEPAQLGPKAKLIVGFALKNELDKNPNGSVTFFNSSLLEIHGGYKAMYSGHDSRGRSFKWIGYLHKDQTIFLYLETPLRYENNLEAAANIALQNFRYASAW
ncbi:MAG TPA: hypothetical protein VFF26_07470 [Gallionella sp.]|nr:hypothetical protein [Gallionella sp.]